MAGTSLAMTMEPRSDAGEKIAPGENLLHHFRWRDIYHFVRVPVYQRFWCDCANASVSLRVSQMQRRL